MSAFASSGFSTSAFSVLAFDFGQVVEQPSGGSGYPVYGKYIRPKGIGEFLDVAISEIYEAGTKKEIPIETKQAFAKVIKPYTKSKAKIPDVDTVDWKALEQDVERVEQLLVIWQQMLDDEELILMTYIQFYYH